jgi:hypothetical protein
MPEKSPALNPASYRLDAEQQETMEQLRAERPRLGAAMAQQAPPPPPPPALEQTAGTATVPVAPVSTAGTPTAEVIGPDLERTKRNVRTLWQLIHNLPAQANPAKMGWAYMRDPVAEECAKLLVDAFPELSILDQFRVVKIVAAVGGIFTIYTRQYRRWKGLPLPAAALDAEREAGHLPARVAKEGAPDDAAAA